MGFEVRLTEKADQDYLRLPAHLQAYMDRELYELGESPSRNSRPAASPPYPPGGMIWECDWRVGVEWHHFTIFYFYAQDETSLEVVSIGHVDYSPGH